MTIGNPSTAETGGHRQGHLPALIGLVGALLLWLLADEIQSRIPALQAALAAAETQSIRKPTSSLSDARTIEAEAKQRRSEIESRLATSESAQMTRAKLGQDLRQRCEATGAQNCTVRLAEDTRVQALSPGGTAPGARPASASAPRGRTPEPASLEALGISKSRAVITGLFQRAELNQLTQNLKNDTDAYWRINGVTVRGNSFEMDVERHILATTAVSAVRP